VSLIRGFTERENKNLSSIYRFRSPKPDLAFGSIVLHVPFNETNLSFLQFFFAICAFTLLESYVYWLDFRPDPGFFLIFLQFSKAFRSFSGFFKPVWRFFLNSFFQFIGGNLVSDHCNPDRRYSVRDVPEILSMIARATFGSCRLV